MDNQDQRRTQAHTAGQESHGVHLCHKCGWPFPNPHPSAKHRRAHKKICGTVEGYKLSLSEGQTHLNGADDEHVSDDDHKRPGLVVSGPNSLDTGKNEKGNDGVGEKVIRSEDEVFSDAVADFSDSGLSPEIKERLQEDGLDSGADVERVDIKEPKISGSSGDKDFNAADVSQLIVKATEDCQIQNPNFLPSEYVKERNAVELQDQLSSPTVDSLSNIIANLRTEDLIIVDSDQSSDSPPSKAESMPETLPVKSIYSGENVIDCSLISDAKETNLKEKDEINSNISMVESFDNIVGEKSEGVSEIAVSDVVSLDHQVGDRSLNLKEKNGAEIYSNRDVVEVVESSYNVVGVTCQAVSAIAVSDLASLDHQFGDGAVNLKEKNDAEFLSLLPQGSLALEAKSVVITNDDAQGEFAHVVPSATVADEISQGKEEVNVNVDPLLTCDDRTDVAHHQTEYGDFDHKGVVSQNPFLYSSESLKHEEDDFKDAVIEEHNFHFNTSQLSEQNDILSPDMHVTDNSSMKMEPNSEHMPEEMHAEEFITVESYQKLDEIDTSTIAIKTEISENHMVHFSKEHRPDDVCENSQQISLPEGSLMASSNESQRDASFGSAISETTNVINIDNISCYEKNKIEINDVAVDGKVVDATVENDDIILKDFQPGDLLQSEVKQSDDLFKSDDAGEIGKTERYITDAQYTEMAVVEDTSSPKSSSSHLEVPALSQVGNDEPARKSNVTECAIINPLSGAQEDIKEDEINVNIKLNEYNKFLDTSADLHQAQNVELPGKAAEHVTLSYTSSPVTAEPSAQHDSAVDNPGEPGREVSGITAVPVQDQTGNNLDKLSSSGVDVSVDSSSRCDSLEGNWGSVSVLSMQSDAPAVTEAETLPSNGLLASTEAGKSSLNNLKAATSERQQSEKSEMSELPSFMTLVEPRQVSPKPSEIEKGQSPQQPDSTSQAGWFPTLTQVVNESQGRKKNEEIIAKVTNWSTSKEHTNLKSLLGEAAHSNKPKSPKVEENSMNQKNSKVPENNGSGLTTVNSILGPESPAAQTVKGDAAKEWNSPARYPADIKREKRKVKSRPYWIQLVCCTSVDHQRR